MTNEVYINRISSFLPNEKVGNVEMEDYLGRIDNQDSKGKGLVLRNNGIKTRYYALDKDGNVTHTNAEITAEAIRKLFDKEISMDQVELLACGTTSPDQHLPSHTSMVHGLLECPPVEIMSPAGACNAGMQAMKYAFLSVASGNSSNAVCAGSERFSPYMLAKNFESETARLKELKKNPFIAFEKDFLRWMLSDGAGAAFIQDKPNTSGLSYKIDWIEFKSFANELETCMYAGAEKLGNGELKSWLDFEPDEWLYKTVFSVKQDVKLLSANIVPKGTAFLNEVLKRKNYNLDEIDFFLPHISSEYFRKKIEEELKKWNMDIPQQKWFTNLTKVGNIGSASVFLMLEELYNSGKLKKGHNILIMVPESARFSYAFASLKVV